MKHFQSKGSDLFDGIWLWFNIKYILLIYELQKIDSKILLHLPGLNAEITQSVLMHKPTSCTNDTSNKCYFDVK